MVMSTADLAPGDLVVAGHPFANIGMGQQTRACHLCLKGAGGRPKLRDIYALNPRTDPDYERDLSADLVQRLSRVANIFNLNGDEVDQALTHLNDANFQHAFNVVAPAWELPTYPAVWARQLDRFDEIWAISTFTRNSIAAATKKPVLAMPMAVEPTLSEFVSRRSLSLPEHAFIFLFFFDFSSFMARKNPFAVIDAFNALADRHPKAPLHLVMKHKGGKADSADAARLREAVSRRADQIQMIERPMSNAETRSLIRNADCFVSLHRAEGFGFGLAESMALGTPAIATGYSGNLDFMGSDNSWLVDYRMVPVQSGEYPYGDGQSWADPDMTHAVNLMEAVFLDRAEARLRASRARLHMIRNFSYRAIGLRYLERLETALGPVMRHEV
jgi:glycosyltransferase involved in cell wall biosynthesis